MVVPLPMVDPIPVVDPNLMVDPIPMVEPVPLASKSSTTPESFYCVAVFSLFHNLRRRSIEPFPLVSCDLPKLHFSTGPASPPAPIRAKSAQ